MHRLALPAILLMLLPAAAQDKKPQKPEAPKVVVALPLGVAPGKTTRVTLRGKKLDEATEVRFKDGKATAKVVAKGKANVPNMQDASKVGDTQVEIDVTLPADAPQGEAGLVVVSPAGESQAHALLVERATAVLVEKEPNEGFKESQAVMLPAVIEGCIARPQDVDVFRFEGKAGQRVIVEVVAARRGSSLDSLLALYDGSARLLATNDDVGGPDSRLEATLPADGIYHVSLIDAHDQGGPVHVYRLALRSP